MPKKYEMVGAKQSIYIHVYEVLNISDLVTIEYPRGIYEPIRETFYDVNLDNGREVRMKSEFGEQLKIGDHVQYNIVVDDYTKFDPDNYTMKLNLVV